MLGFSVTRRHGFKGRRRMPTVNRQSIGCMHRLLIRRLGPRSGINRLSRMRATQTRRRSNRISTKQTRGWNSRTSETRYRSSLSARAPGD
jgi:hypothetical protein